MTVNFFINTHKLLVIPVVVGLMAYFHNWSNDAFIYLALHGSYGLIWVMKESLFPDKKFEQQVPWAVGLGFIFIPMLSYYIAPYLLTSQHVAGPPWLLGLAIAVFVFGVFFHYVGDAQKYFTMRLQKGLIVDGLFGRTRNPNYLGEILIYGAYGILAEHWLPFVVLAGWTFIFFVPNMVRKDRSLARHPGFVDYKRRTGLLLPRLFPAAVA